MTNEKCIRRNYCATFREVGESGLIEGTPIVYDSPTDIGGLFEEVIERGAISQETVSASADVRFFWNHELSTMAMARTIIPITKPGGMELTCTDTGVSMRMNPNRKRSDVNDLCIGIDDGVINGMSFMFYVADERWENLDTDYPTRHILRIDPVIEVSAVNFPAYTSTSITLSREDGSAENDLRALEIAREKRESSAAENAENKRSAEISKILKMYRKA